MEDFGKYFTIEFKGSKGWEVIAVSEGLTEIVNKFREYCLADGDLQEYRLTSPSRHTSRAY
jgi:hypothetical protein